MTDASSTTPVAGAVRGIQPYKKVRLYIRLRGRTSQCSIQWTDKPDRPPHFDQLELPFCCPTWGLQPHDSVEKRGGESGVSARSVGQEGGVFCDRHYNQPIFGSVQMVYCQAIITATWTLPTPLYFRWSFSDPFSARKIWSRNNV